METKRSDGTGKCIFLCALLIVTLLLSMAACGARAQDAGVLETQIPEQISRYQIETIVEGELLRVAIINNTGPFGTAYYYPGANYGNDFAAALSEIGKNYEINKIDSILYYAGDGSLTGEIYVHVYPRQ